MVERRNKKAPRRRGTRELIALNRMGQSVLSSLDLQTVLKHVVDEVSELLPSDGISILLREQDQLSFAAVSGGAAPLLLGYHMPLDAGVAGEVMQMGRSIHITGHETQERMDLRVRDMLGYLPRSMLAVPLRVRDQVIGLMEAVCNRPGAFCQDDLHLLEAAASWAAIAIANARQHEELSRHLRETQVMSGINLALSRTLVLSEIFSLIVNGAREVIPNAETAVIHVLDEPNQTLDAVAVAGSAPETESDLKMHSGEGIAGHVLARGIPINVGNVQDEPRYVSHSALSRTGSLLVVPLQNGERRLGTISVQSARPRAFSTGDEYLLSYLGTQASIAIENAHLFQETQERANQNARLYTELQNALSQEQAMRARLVLADKLAALGRMTATVAHELNNPLQSIRNCLYIISHGDWLPASQEQYLKIAVSEIDRLSGLIMQLRSVYRSGNGKPLEPEGVGELLEAVRSLIMPHLSKNKIRVEFSSASRELERQKIPARLKQVFVNLCLNAVDAMQPNGGQLTVRLFPSDGGTELGVAFTDTGHGIKEEDLAHIFEPFFTTKEMGMGLGLAICYDIVQGYGGRLTVESRHGIGSTFTVWLPLDTGVQSR